MVRLACGCVLAFALALGCDESAPRGLEAPREPAHSAPPATEPTPLKPAVKAPSVEAATLSVVLLGTGTPIPDPRRAGPATAIVVNGQAYLIDAGPGVVRNADAARRAGIAALDAARLDRLFLTHLHSDHTLGAADVMRSPAVIGRTVPLQVYGPEGTVEMFEALERAYAVDARMRREAEGLRTGFAVRAHEVAGGWVYRDAHVTIRALRVAHGLFEHALGYHIEGAGRRVVVSGDTAPSEAIVEACAGCDVLVHEVYCASGLSRLDPSVQQYHRRFHTSSRELAALATRARPGLLVLTHLLWFGCGPLQLLEEVRAGYPGEVVLGEDVGVY